MSFFDILKLIDNGSLHTTEGIYPIPVPEVQDQNFNVYQLKQFEYYCSILNCIDKDLITGDKFLTNESTQYKNLRLTKSGKETLRFSQLTLKDIDNSYGKDSIKIWLLRPVTVAIIVTIFTVPISGVIGFYIGKQLSTSQPAIQQKYNRSKGSDPFAPIENITATIEVCVRNLPAQQMHIDTWRELAKSGLLQLPNN